MPLLDRYERADILKNMDSATRGHAWRRPVETWICDCGCDIAQWLQRTSVGMAYSQQAWAAGTGPTVIIFETRSDVEEWLALLAHSPLATQSARFASFTDWVWKAWNSGSE